MPFFVGNFDIDSTTIAGRTLRFASYPAGSVTSVARKAVFQQLSRTVPYQVTVFGEVPWDSYTLIQVADDDFSTRGVQQVSSTRTPISTSSPPAVLGNPFLVSLYAHEIFHAWNVKRLRPAEMIPYMLRSRAADDAALDQRRHHRLLRRSSPRCAGKSITPRGFYATTTGKIDNMRRAPPTALEDASLSAWIKPGQRNERPLLRQGFSRRPASRHHDPRCERQQGSLDTVMRELYETTYKRGRGFTNDDWWAAVSRAAGGESFAAFRTALCGRPRAVPVRQRPSSRRTQAFLSSVLYSVARVAVSADDDGFG